MINLGDCTLSCAPGKFEDSINPVSGYVNDDGEIQLTGCHDTLASNQKEAVERMIAENILHFDPNDDSTYNLDVDSKFDGSYVSKVNRYGETYTAIPDVTNSSNRHDPPQVEELDNGTKYTLLQVIVTIILNNYNEDFERLKSKNKFTKISVHDYGTTNTGPATFENGYDVKYNDNELTWVLTKNIVFNADNIPSKGFVVQVNYMGWDKVN